MQSASNKLDWTQLSPWRKIMVGEVEEYMAGQYVISRAILMPVGIKLKNILVKCFQFPKRIIQEQKLHKNNLWMWTRGKTGHDITGQFQYYV